MYTEFTNEENIRGEGTVIGEMHMELLNSWVPIERLVSILFKDYSSKC